MTDTPITDAKSAQGSEWMFYQELVHASFARELERENAKLRAKLEWLYGRFAHCKWADCGPLWNFRPENEKYITRDSWEMMLENKGHD